MRRYDLRSLEDKDWKAGRIKELCIRKGKKVQINKQMLKREGYCLFNASILMLVQLRKVSARNDAAMLHSD